MANEQYVWDPFLGVLVDNDNGDNVDNGDDDAYLEEGSSDLDKDVIPNFIEDVSNVESNNNTQNNGKRKHREHSTQKGGKKGKGRSGIKAKLFSCLDQLLIVF